MVRFINFPASRIGHLSANIELYLSQKDFIKSKIKPRYLDIFYPGYTISNIYLYNKWKEHINIYPEYLIYPIVSTLKFFHLEEHYSISHSLFDRDIENIIDKTKPHISFTIDEELNGERILKKMRINKKNSFVCLIGRDSKYLNTLDSKKDYSYHDHRNVSIKNYMLAAQRLTQLGYYVIRMGKEVESKFESTNPMIIDYANSEFRSEFMDIYLGAKCSFCITSGTGWDNVPGVLFRKPCLYTNHVPLSIIFTWSSKHMNITKRHFNQNSGEEMSFFEIFNHLEFKDNQVFIDATDFKKKMIRLEENTPNEILEALEEFIHIIINKNYHSKEDKLLQDKFAKSFSDHIGKLEIDGIKIHGEIKSIFSTKFLKSKFFE